MLKLLFLAVIVYFVLKTAVRLIRAMRGEEPAPLNEVKPGAPWESAGPDRSYDESDVEDAKFVDV